MATAASTILLFSVGGLVRGTGSGLGCATWPNCFPGQLFPEGTVHSLIEFSHRFLVFVSTILVFVTAFFAWRGYRQVRSILWPALAAIPLVLGQAVLGGIVVKTELNPWWVTAHFAVALAFVADVTVLATNSFLQERQPRAGEREPGYARLALFTVGATAVLLLVGTYVRAKGAGLAFTDWPLMDGKLVPALGGANTAMFVHRVLAALVFLLVIYAMVRARTMTERSKDLVVLSTVAVALFVAQIVVGAAQVWTRLKPWAVVMHVGLSVLVWASLVTLATVARAHTARSGSGAGAPDAGPEAAEVMTSPSAPASTMDRVTAYYRLTKPEIIFLLLVTTVPAMFLAGRGVPSLWLILATLVGGALAAGSANAMNQYLDRDIDQVMKRTRRRPLPSSAVTPERALRFGFVLGAISFFFLAITVNVLAAELALSAIAFYVFVYTMWLKRSTTQNIVIGGAAGAVPALVGWAAVTRFVGGAGLGLVRDHLRVDTAALLGAGPAISGRLCRRGRAHAAGRQGRGRDPAADLPLLAGAVRDLARRWCPWRIWGSCTSPRPWASAAPSSTGRCACGTPAIRPVPGACSSSRSGTSRPSSAPSPWTRYSPSHAEGDASSARSPSISPPSSCSVAPPKIHQRILPEASTT